MRSARPRSLRPPNEPSRDFQLSLSAWVRLISRQAVTALGAEAPANGLTGRNRLPGLALADRHGAEPAPLIVHPPGDAAAADEQPVKLERGPVDFERAVRLPELPPSHAV